MVQYEEDDSKGGDGNNNEGGNTSNNNNGTNVRFGDDLGGHNHGGARIGFDNKAFVTDVIVTDSGRVKRRNIPSAGEIPPSPLAGGGGRGAAAGSRKRFTAAFSSPSGSVKSRREYDPEDGPGKKMTLKKPLEVRNHNNDHHYSELRTIYCRFTWTALTAHPRRTFSEPSTPSSSARE